MKMKRYFAADARQALRELREEQGPDAVILTNRKVHDSLIRKDVLLCGPGRTIAAETDLVQLQG